MMKGKMRTELPNLVARDTDDLDIFLLPFGSLYNMFLFM